VEVRRTARRLSGRASSARIDQGGEDESEHEPADVRPPRHACIGGRAGCEASSRLKELDERPVADVEPGGQPPEVEAWDAAEHAREDPGEEERGDEGLDLAAGEPKDVRAEHGTDGARRADHGSPALRVDCAMREGGRRGGGEVEGEKAAGAEARLDVVAEHDQEEGIADQVERVGVKEGVRDEAERVRERFGPKGFGDEGGGVHEGEERLVALRGNEDLREVAGDDESEERPRDGRCAVTWIDVANGKHERGVLPGVTCRAARRAAVRRSPPPRDA